MLGSDDLASRGSGLILFSDAAGGGGRDLFTMRPDGSGVTRLMSTEGDELSPRWSPDGELLAFVFVGDHREGPGVYVMWPDGTHARRVFGMRGHGEQIVDLSWSPDASDIAFVHEDAGRAEDPSLEPPADERRRSLHVLDVATGQSQQIGRSGPIASVDWSPDGSSLLVTRSGPGETSAGFVPNDLYLVTTDGSGERRLTKDGLSMYGRWSPDGSRIVFESYEPAEGGSTDIYLMDADGSGRMRLAGDPGMDFLPTWSPDGSRILFVSRRTAEGEDASMCHLFVVRVDGSNLRSIRSDPSSTCSADPSWGPSSPLPEPPGEAVPGHVDKVLFLPTLAERPNVTMDALTRGTLVELEGCVILDPGDGSFTLPIWPFGWRLESGGSGAILDDTGAEVAEMGEQLWLGGGYIGEQRNATGFAEELIGREIPERCKADAYFLTSGPTDSPLAG